MENNQILKCSFCGGRAKDRKLLIVSENNKHKICDGCILVCINLVFDEIESKPPRVSCDLPC